MPTSKTAVEGSPWTQEARRMKNGVATNLNLDVEAKELLREMAPPKSYGAFVSGLIRAEKARLEERRRLRRKRAAALDT